MTACTRVQHVMTSIDYRQDIEDALKKDNHPIGRTDSAESFEMSRTWLETCIREHKHCGPAYPDFRPTRLLQLNSPGKFIRLCEGTEIPESVRYATLSHCWGGDVPGKLTKQNIDSLRSGVSQDLLGQTFQDAVRIALELGVDFLWIDSFCIIQDSEEDWHSESVKMAHVYGNATCNIAATSAANGSEGCFSMHNTGALQAIKVGIPTKRKEDRDQENSVYPQEDEHYSMFVTNVQQWFERFQKEPLIRRAWVVQERLLSPRIIHYERNQLLWECNELLAAETFPQGFGSLLSSRKRPLRVPLDPTLRNTQEEEIPGQALHEIWRPVVNSYALTDVTRPTDRLIALYGVGKRIEHICGWPYVAGMFLKNLQSQLCWAANGHHEAQPPEKAIVPSWSWLSVGQPVDMMPQWDLVESDATGEGPKAKDLKEEHLCQIRDVEKGRLPEEVSGHVSYAKLHVSCYLVPAEFWNPTDVERERLNEHASLLEEHRIMNEHRFKTRPIWTDFKFMESNQRIQERRRHYSNTLAYGSVKISWDMWSELDPSMVHDLWFMPVYKVREYSNWSPGGGYEKRPVLHGLILQANQIESGTRTFRRCGTFVIDAGWEEFWKHALSFPHVAGVDLVRDDGVPVPNHPTEKLSRGTNRRRFVKRDGILQYRITIV